MSRLDSIMIRVAPSDFTPGDVVYDIDSPSVLGLITDVHERDITVVFQDGERAAGPGLLRVIRHRKPRSVVAIPPGALGNRGWNREQAITAALRRAGILP